MRSIYPICGLMIKTHVTRHHWYMGTADDGDGCAVSEAVVSFVGWYDRDSFN